VLGGAISGAGSVGGLGLLLGLAGAAKLRDGTRAVRAAGELGVPSPIAAVRVLAAAEIGCAAIAFAAPSRISASIAGFLFGGFALAAWRLSRSGATDGCGCFGPADRGPVGARHVVLNAAAAVGAAALAVTAPPSVVLLARDHGPAVALLGVAIAVAVAIAGRRLFVAGGERERAAGLTQLVDSSARRLERRMSRRSALVRLTVAGSALCVAPLRYLLYPESAMAVVVPGRCSSGLCLDGYTAFCCEINRGANECPAGTFAGGWWMCTDYPGHRLCAQQGVRYYIDCNRIPGQHRSGGCRCANDNCAERRVSCNVFRYGQCNTQVAGTTEVVCRVVTCTNPSLIGSFNCGSHLSIDNAVCGHDAGCLGAGAGQLPGAGGV
jgi:hypothetical protein